MNFFEITSRNKGATVLLLVALSMLFTVLVGGTPLVGTTARVSVRTDDSEIADGTLDGIAMAANVEVIAFESEAADIVAGDDNLDVDIFVADVPSGDTNLASVDDNGVVGNGDSRHPSVSAEARYIAFDSAATNLVSGDTNESQDIFVRDRQSETTERVSVATGGAESDGASSRPSISDNGRYVAFMSSATNLVVNDTNGKDDVFVHDRNSGTTTRVSVATNGTQGDFNALPSAISGNGRYVVFASAAGTLVSDDNNGLIDIFVHDRNTSTTTRVSVATGGGQLNGVSVTPDISADGRFITFVSSASDAVVNDTNGIGDIFVHDSQTATTTRVSVSSKGEQITTYAAFEPSISADGRFVAFHTRSRSLIKTDDNGMDDVYIHDLETEKTIRLSVGVDGDEGIQGDGRSFNGVISADGKQIAFYTEATNLLGLDVDTNDAGDIYVREPDWVDDVIIDNGGPPTVFLPVIVKK